MHLFPQTGFDQSATTSVFLGVLVSWFFTETLGWVFVGLVVPGYLASLFLLDARSAGIDVLEATITYGVAHVLGELLSHTRLTSRTFGRERFLLILVVSVIVRLGMEAVALPLLLPRASWAYSIGLVVVPLLANACWKTGLVSGLIQRGVPTLIVYLLLRFVLLPHTNLSLGGFYLATENVASSFLASPRAYLMLLTGASLAAAANVRWGWDYNGILVPALLSLTLGGPERLLITFGESLLLVWSVRLLLRATRVGRWNIEGPRRPVLFFSLDYALRFGLASVGGRLYAAHGGAELTGFGYLLPTLMAVKISRLGLAAPVLLPTASVSTVAYALGTLFGFAAQKLDPGTLTGFAVTREVGRAPEQPELAALWTAALARPTGSAASLTALDWAELLASARDGARSGRPPPSTGRVEVQNLAENALLLRERFESAEQRAGHPSVITRGDIRRARLLLVVTHPLSDALSALVAGRLLALKKVDVVVLAGSEAHGVQPGDARHAVEVARRYGELPARFQREPALVLTLRTSGGGELGVRSSRHVAADAGVAALEEALTGTHHPVAPTGRAQSERDAELEVPRTMAEAFVGANVGSTIDDLPLGASFDDLACEGQPQSLEYRLALRHLLLRPLLSAPSELSWSLLGVSAKALGFDPPRKLRLASGDDAVVLTARGSKAGLALVARLQPGSGTIVELRHGHGQSLRRLGLALFGSLDADAMLVRPCLEGDKDDGELFEAAHREAMVGAAQSPSLLELELAAADRVAPTAALATWGPDGALATRAQLALQDFGLDVVRQPLGRHMREIAGNDLPSRSALVAVTVSSAGLSSEAWRSPVRILRDWSWLAQRDAEPLALARALLQLPHPSSAGSPELIRAAQRAVLEQSVVAQSQLRALLAAGHGRAEIARGSFGIFLVLVSESADGTSVVVLPIASGAPPRLEQRNAVALAECTQVFTGGGVCLLKGPR